MFYTARCSFCSVSKHPLSLNRDWNGDCLLKRTVSLALMIVVSVEECVEEKLMLEETDKHLQNLPVRE